jgi:chromosome partitioning protein
MRSIAWISEKGGTAKTTSAINTAVGLAKLGNRVLLIDTDPQANAGLVLLEGKPAGPPTLASVLLGDAGASEAIRPTRTAGLDILPADVSLADASVTLGNLIGREARLRAALAEVEDDYDFAIADTSPTRSVLTINVLVFAAEVLIPIEPGLFSLSGLGQLQNAIEDVRRYLGNGGLKITGLVLTRTRNDGVSRDVESQLRATFGELVCRTAVPSSVKVEEAHGRFQSVLDYAPRSPGARAYEALVAEIIDHGRAKIGTGTPADGTVATDNPRKGRRAG